TAGHAVGDRALRDTAALLRRTFRDSDLVARIGGDEYAVLVRHAATDSAGVLAERLKRQVRDFNRRAARPYQLSISLGFATHKASTLGSVAGLLDRADRALYRTSGASTKRADSGPPWRSSATLAAPIPTARSGTTSSSCSRGVTPTSRSRTRSPTCRPSSGA